MVKDTLFYKKHTLHCRGKLLRIDSPLVMGILNITPDSFFDGNKYRTENEIIEQAGKMLAEGAGLIDVGGYSTRPGAGMVSEEEELKRVVPAFAALVKHFPEAVFSVDTFRASVAKQVLDQGAGMVNDISGGQFDPVMFETVAAYGVPYVLMHSAGSPDNLHRVPDYPDAVLSVSGYFMERVSRLKALGVKDIVLDPGFGFGKSLEDNYELLRQLNYFNTIFEMPILVGLSRKSMVNKVLGTKAAEALNGTSVLHTIALLNGASMLRVHDVKAACEAIKLVEYYKTGQ